MRGVPLHYNGQFGHCVFSGAQISTLTEDSLMMYTLRRGKKRARSEFLLAVLIV